MGEKPRRKEQMSSHTFHLKGFHQNVLKLFMIRAEIGSHIALDFRVKKPFRINRFSMDDTILESLLESYTYVKQGEMP